MFCLNYSKYRIIELTKAQVKMPDIFEWKFKIPLSCLTKNIQLMLKIT